MAIASGSADGIRADSAAKESAGAAATLGSQTAAAANEVIVPDAITANNEGNLEVTPSYVGRMFALRPWEMRLAEVPTIQAGGSGYAVSDTITLNGVAGVNGGAPILTVTAVSSGAVTAVSINQASSVQIRRGAMTSAPSPADNPVGQASTSGSGTGATFNCVWEPHFELRIITADSSNTLTVHENWETPPVSGDAWAVSYILEDYATLTGLTLRAQSGVFEATRRIKIGPSTDTARHGWLAMNDGKALELDNVTDQAFEIANGGVWTVGQVAGGESVNGAYVSTSGTGGTNIYHSFNPGALFFLHDLQIRSPRESVGWEDNSTDGNLDTDENKFKQEVKCILRNAKMFDAKQDFHPAGQRMRDVTIQNSGSGGAFNVDLSLDGASGNSGDPTYDMNRVTIFNASSSGLRSRKTTNTNTVVFDKLRNITMLAGVPTNRVQVSQNETFRMVNPVWGGGRVTSFNEYGEPGINHGTTPAVLEELTSFVGRTIDAAGDPVSDVVGYIYDGYNDNLPTENTNQSLSAAYDPIADSRFEDEIEAGEVAYFTDVLTHEWPAAYESHINYDFLAYRGYKYGRVPTLIPIIPEEGAAGIETQPLLLVDSAITEADQATALTNPTTNPTVTKHGPGETDTRPMKAIAYDAGTGSAPTIGETITGGTSGADGVVVDYEGDGVAGTLLLDTWDGVEFDDNENLTGGTSTFDATSDTATFYEEYTWEVDANGESGTILYDYLAARMAEDPITAAFEDVIVWGGNEPQATQLVFLGADGYFTPRAVRSQTGLLLDTVTPGFSDDFNRADQNLSASSNWDDIDNSTQTIRIVSNTIRGPASGTDRVVTAVNTAAYDGGAFVFEAYASGTVPRSQYVRATVTALPAISRFIGICLHLNTDLETGVVLYVSSTGGVTLRYLDFSTAAGQVWPLGSSATGTVAANDVITLVRTGKFIIGFKNGVEIIRGTDIMYANGQPGVFAQQADSTGQLDDFECGDLADADFKGEGVWIHDRGAGTYDYFTSDSGAQFQVPATVTLTVQVDDEGGSPVQGARVRIANDPDSPGAASIAEGTTNASGAFSASYSYSTDTDVITKVRLKGFKNFRTTGTITASGLTVGVRFVADTIVDLP